MTQSFNSVPSTKRLGRMQVQALAQTIPEVPAVKNLTLVSARDFIIAMRKADRQGKINLIDLYVGYDPAQDFGVQELWALRKANNILNPPKHAGLYSIKVDQG